MARQPAATDAGTAETPAPSPPRMPIESARRVVESVVIAVATSTGLYLVGSVYTDAFYGRMSIATAALDLAPPFIALQASRVVRSLLEYPVLFLLLVVLYRFAIARLPRVPATMAALRDRYGRLALLVANGAIASPLLAAAIVAGGDPALVQSGTVLSEVAGLMQISGIALVVYVVWLSLGPRRFLLDEVRRRQVLPIALLFALYLLDALVATADNAARDAELLMIGASDSSVAAAFTLAGGVQPLPTVELLLVAVRNGHYFVVERQPYPPSPQPVAYAIPFRAVDAVRLQRIYPAAPAIEDPLFYWLATPAAE